MEESDYRDSITSSPDPEPTLRGEALCFKTLIIAWHSRAKTFLSKNNVLVSCDGFAFITSMQILYYSCYPERKALTNRTRHIMVECGLCNCVACSIFFFVDLRDLGTKLEKELLYNEAGVIT